MALKCQPVSLQRNAAFACPGACVVGHDLPGVPKHWEAVFDLVEVEWRLQPLDDGGLNVIEVHLSVGLDPVRQKHPKPFVWIATAEEILEKVSRGRVALASIPADNESPHRPPDEIGSRS